MTGATIKQFDTLLSKLSGQLRIIIRIVLGIILSTPTVAVQAPAHIDCLLERLNRLLAHIAVAVFTVQPGSNVWAMIKMDEIRHLIDRHPIDRLVGGRFGVITLYIAGQLLQFSRPLINSHTFIL